VFSEREIQVTFSNAMASDALEPSHYELSGPGIGYLASQPSTVNQTGSTTYQLLWLVGSMTPALPITLTVTNVHNSVGALMDPPGVAVSTTPGLFVDFVTVGDVGNASDSTGYGSVNHTYRIGKYEVTNSDYCIFLNSVASSDPLSLYHDKMGSDVAGGITRMGTVGSFSYTCKPNRANKPVNFVNFYSATRFVNWLNNGAHSGSDTEDGAYCITGGSTPTLAGPRRSGAQFFIPSENEWYKAAFYKGGATNAYWLYATRSQVPPARAIANAAGDISNPGNVANFILTGCLTTVGSGGLLSASAYGTYDQAGNVVEWTETPAMPMMQDGRVGRGGGYRSDGEGMIQSTSRFGSLETNVMVDWGFRVAHSAP